MSKGLKKWAFITGLLNGLLLWMREYIRGEEERRRKKKAKKLRKKQQRAGQPVQPEADHVRRH